MREAFWYLFDEVYQMKDFHKLYLLFADFEDEEGIEFTNRFNGISL